MKKLNLFIIPFVLIVLTFGCREHLNEPDEKYDQNKTLLKGDEELAEIL